MPRKRPTRTCHCMESNKHWTKRNWVSLGRVNVRARPSVRSENRIAVRYKMRCNSCQREWLTPSERYSEHFARG